MTMDLSGRTVVLYGDFDPAVTRRLTALGARVAETVTDETDAIFLAFGARGPIPRTDAMLRTPYFDEEALLGLLERQEAQRTGNGAFAAAREHPPLFLPPGALDDAGDAKALCALLEDADWSAFTPDRDLPALRACLTELERVEGGVTDAHRLATRRLLDTGTARLLHPYGHDVEIVGHALSPDGRYLATGSWTGDDYEAGGVLQVWEVATGRCVNTVTDIDGGVGWPDYARTIQWSADARRLAVAFCTNMVGVWSADADSSLPVATIDVSDGNSRPSEFALSPDGRRVYHHCGTNGDGGLQGCLVPLERGRLSWLPNHVDDDHPYLMTRRMPEVVRAEFERPQRGDDGDFRVGQWIERPVWSPDGRRLFGSNALCLDAESREVRWYTPATMAMPSPDGRLVAAVTDDGLFIRDAADGRIRFGPLPFTGPCSLHWTALRGGGSRLALLTSWQDMDPPAVHLFDDDRQVGSASIPHAEWPDDEPWVGDRAPWAWAPGGEEAAFLTWEDTVQVWSFADPARARRLRILPAEDAHAVHWGAEDTLVLVGATRVRFVRAGTGEDVGDFTFLRVPEGRRPVEGDAAVDFRERIFALDEDTWAMTLAPDAVIVPPAPGPGPGPGSGPGHGPEHGPGHGRAQGRAPGRAPGREEALDSVLAWAVGRRHAWPVRWGELRVVPDALAAVELPGSQEAEMLREYREELAAPVEEPVPWPPPNTATADDLFNAAHRSLATLERDRWGYHTGRYLRVAARLRARRGGAAAAMAMVADIPYVAEGIAAASDVTMILARGGRANAARAAFDRAETLLARAVAAGEELDADTASSFAGACRAMGDAARAEEWFRRARAAITVEPNPWEDHLAVMHSMLECGREDLVRELLADRDSHPPAGFHSEQDWMVYLVRGGRIDLAREFQALPGWEVPYEVLRALAEAGRPDLLEGWGGHNWALEDELIEQAELAAWEGTLTPIRPLTPTERDVEELAEGYAEILRTPHAKRQRPIRVLIDKAAACGHLSAVLDLLELVPSSHDINDRPGVAFGALWIALTGSRGGIRMPW
ncbi:WD40 repeat domain-containing protein [Streptomyces sp. 6N223]|uniref:WD40 repeat domain-containing protein n=1 Tax=Streptomyces sp. 6N223 TaxID=3457412 RepID=UPI003FCF2D69